MPNLSSSLGSANPAIPLVNPSQIGQAAGLHMHYPTFSAFTTAVTSERANVSASNPIWADAQPMTIASEGSRVKRVWSVGLNHARSVSVGQYSAILGADSNVVLLASGQPSSGTGNNGDLSYDSSTGVVYLKSGGLWATAGNANGLFSNIDGGTPTTNYAGTSGIDGGTP